MRVNGFQLTPHFSLHEFACPCCKTVRLHPRLVEKLQGLRELWNRPLAVNSGYRCESHNAAVGGVPKSRHRLGLAADLWIPGREQEQFRILAKICGFSKVLLYESRNFAHVEVEDFPAPQAVLPEAARAER